MWYWLKGWLTLTPHFYIGGEANPYLLRWYVLPRNHFLNIYFHKFMRDDEDRALHDHPWWFISWLVWGGYSEYYIKNGHTKFAPRLPFSIAYRPATHTHRVVLRRDNKGKMIPCWTIVITGPKSRVWGFFCEKGFVPWYDFVDHSDHGNVGKGCGE